MFGRRPAWSTCLSQRIYVGNIPFTATEQEVEQLFAPHGEVLSCALPTDRETGRARGFGFVEMSQEAAAKAIEALDGTDFGGRALTVSEARPRPDRGGRDRDGGGFGRQSGGRY